MKLRLRLDVQTGVQLLFRVGWKNRPPTVADWIKQSKILSEWLADDQESAPAIRVGQCCQWARPWSTPRATPTQQLLLASVTELGVWCQYSTVCRFFSCSVRTTLFHVHLTVRGAHKPCISNESCHATNHHENVEQVLPCTHPTALRSTPQYSSATY